MSFEINGRLSSLATNYLRKECPTHFISFTDSFIQCALCLDTDLLSQVNIFGHFFRVSAQVGEKKSDEKHRLKSTRSLVWCMYHELPLSFNPLVGPKNTCTMCSLPLSFNLRGGGGGGCNVWGPGDGPLEMYFEKTRTRRRKREKDSERYSPESGHIRKRYGDWREYLVVR